VNPTLKSEAQFPSKLGFYLNEHVIAHIHSVRKRPLWFLISFDPNCIEKVFGTGNDAIQALGVFEVAQ
jgi:hypothetical protein